MSEVDDHNEKIHQALSDPLVLEAKAIIDGDDRSQAKLDRLRELGNLGDRYVSIIVSSLVCTFYATSERIREANNSGGET